MPQAGLHVILGAGPSGRGIARRLRSDHRDVRIVTRSGKAHGLEGMSVVAADISDPEAAMRACQDARVVFGCVGLEDYRGWAERWPPMMQGMLAGAESAGARLVFIDNLYMYGPTDGPLHEELPLTDYGEKPALRSRLTRMWQDAQAAGRVQVVAVRASDFYGPDVRKAMLGDFVTANAVANKPSRLLGDPELVHTFTYMPDLVRAAVDLADAEDDVCGQAWHVPSAPARPVREVVEMIYLESGNRPRWRATPEWMLGLVGLFDGNMREMKELLFQWQRPYRVSHDKFAARFQDDFTPLEDGIRETVRWFRAQL